MDASAIEKGSRRSQLLRAIRSVDDAIEELGRRGQIVGLQRLRADLHAALRLHDRRAGSTSSGLA
jgi:hypothetical protein